MRITFVGHASLLVEHDGCCVLIDPWLVGDAFNDSWSAYPSPVLADHDLERVTHVWISHEHPDHLSIPTLRSLPEEVRRRVTLLYQRHWSPQVATFLRTLGFADVVELVHGGRHRLARDFEVRLHQVGHEDSCLSLHSDRFTILDLNDCKPSPAVLRRIYADTGRVDVLLSQFSIAGWPGNPGDAGRLQAAGERVLQEFDLQITTVDPRFVVPLASFVRFSHEENAFMNAGINRVDEVVRRIPPDKRVVFYPGDTWSIDDGAWAGTESALSRYAAAYDDLPQQPLRSHASETFERVLEAAAERLDDLQRQYHRRLLRRVPSVEFYVTDLDRSFVFDPSGREVNEVRTKSSPCVIELHSQAARYTFSHRWGLPTLLISGRFRLHGDERRFRRLKQLGALYSNGYTTKGLRWSLLDARHRRFLRSRWRNLLDDFVKRAG